MAEEASGSMNGDHPGSGEPTANGRKSPAADANSRPEDGNTQLSNADKKKQAKAEKAARRAKAKEGQSSAPAVSNGAPAPESGPSTQTRSQKDDPKSTAASNQPKGQPPAQHKRTGSVGSTSQPKSLPIRRRPSQSVPKEQLQTKRQVSFLAHLYGQQRRRTLEGTPKDIHLAISSLALQQGNYTVCGSHARCVAMLLALRSVINSYTTPHGTSLPRHLVSQHLSPQLAHLKSSRPFSVSQANAIQWLKNVIGTVDPSLAEDEAKTYIMESIDTFIRDKFTVADQVIADTASDRIKEGDVIAVFGKSAVVQSVLVNAINRGIKFMLVVIDSRPLLEGKHLVRYLAPHVEISYALITGLGTAMKGVTKCFLGAHGIFANGRLQSRAGTALVAMAAKAHKVPVIVCAESIKLTDRIAIDSIVGNELAPEEELLAMAPTRQPESNSNPHSEPPKGEKHKQSSGAKDPHGKGSGNQSSEPKPSGGGTSQPGRGSTLLDKDNLRLINALYDITPAENLDIIITELGSFPPTSAPVVHRISAGP